MCQPNPLPLSLPQYLPTNIPLLQHPVNSHALKIWAVIRARPFQQCLRPTMPNRQSLMITLIWLRSCLLPQRILRHPFSSLLPQRWWFDLHPLMHVYRFLGRLDLSLILPSMHPTEKSFVIMHDSATSENEYSRLHTFVYPIESPRSVSHFLRCLYYRCYTCSTVVSLYRVR